MADNKFNLDKGERRKFDLGKDGADKKTKPKFNLNKDDAPAEEIQASQKTVAQKQTTPKANSPKPASAKPDNTKPSSAKPNNAKPSSAAPTSTPPVTPAGDDEDSSSGKGKWLIAAIVVIAIVVFGIWYSHRDKGGETPAPTEQLASDSDSTAKAAQDTSTTAQNASATSAAAASSETAQTTDAAAQPQSASTDIPASVEEAAREVLSGKYGNNPDRRRALGSRYKEIQRVVNRMVRERNVR